LLFGAAKTNEHNSPQYSAMHTTEINDWTRIRQFTMEKLTATGYK